MLLNTIVGLLLSLLSLFIMCGIIGLISKNTDVPLKLYEGLTFLQHRGQDSAGICNEEECIKGDGLVKTVFQEDSISKLISNIGIGHVRYGTTGNFDSDTIQPLFNRVFNRNIYLCHNGHIMNTDELSTLFEIDEYKSDSELLLKVFVMKLQQQSSITEQAIFDICIELMKVVKGSYSILMLIEGFGMICFRDIFGIRPLCYGISGNDYLVASESVVLDVLDFQIARDVKPGEIIIFEKEQQKPRFMQFQGAKLYPCLFEYIYFARIDSVLSDISIYDARYKLGELLGEKIKSIQINDIDVIIPVPETSLIFALGLQSSLNVKMQYGLVKNSYIERTFIMKDDKIIKKNIKRKLNVVQSVMQNKNVLIVDDSIVRGNTSMHIVSLAKQAGANKIYFGSGSPPILHPNNYGIYIPERDKLVAVNRSFRDIADVLGASRVIYNDLIEVVNCLKNMNSQLDGFETSMFNNLHLFS